MVPLEYPTYDSTISYRTSHWVGFLPPVGFLLRRLEARQRAADGLWVISTTARGYKKGLFA